jgi:hypothetical protein
MTVTWLHGEAGYTRHAFKNQIAGLPSICGRGRFPQDATPPATHPPVCKWCAAKSRPPDGHTTGGAYEQGLQWAQHYRLIGPVHRSPKGYEH